MKQIKDQPKFDNSLPYPRRLDEAIDNWLKRRLPLVHRYTHWWVNWLSRPHPQARSWPATLGAWLILILLIVLLWYS